jgi:hypothetical protein
MLHPEKQPADSWGRSRHMASMQLQEHCHQVCTQQRYPEKHSGDSWGRNRHMASMQMQEMQVMQIRMGRNRHQVGMRQHYPEKQADDSWGRNRHRASTQMQEMQVMQMRMARNRHQVGMRQHYPEKQVDDSWGHSHHRASTQMRRCWWDGPLEESLDLWEDLWNGACPLEHFREWRVMAQPLAARMQNLQLPGYDSNQNWRNSAELSRRKQLPALSIQSQHPPAKAISSFCWSRHPEKKLHGLFQLAGIV